MKTILTLIMFITTSVIFSQTSLEKKVFRIVNEYRDSLGLNQLEWDTTCYHASGLQSSYLKLNNDILTHSNTNKGYETVSDRYKKSGGILKDGEYLIAEISNSLNKNYKVCDSLVEEKIAKDIFLLWRNSIEHNKIMIQVNLKLAGCSVRMTETPGNTKSWKHYEVVTTMVLTD